MKKIRSFFVNVIVFCGVFWFVFFFLYELFKCIQVFVVFTYEWIRWVPIIASAIVALGVCICIDLNARKLKETRLSFWMNNNWPKILLAYIILILFISSVTKNVIWTSDEIQDVLTLEWTIFGLSLTIFLVWNVIIVEYLKKKKPQETEKKDYLRQYELLIDKQAFSQEVDSTFSKIVLLSINLLILLVTSALVYIDRSSETVFTQFLARCAFYFSTNTIVSFFFDMLKPLRAEKDALKKTSQVSMHDLNKAKASVLVNTLFSEGVKKINESNEYSEEEKKNLSVLYVELMRDALLKIAKKDSKDTSTTHTETEE